MSGVGGIIYDKDSIYIELGGSHSHTAKLVMIFIRHSSELFVCLILFYCYSRQSIDSFSFIQLRK